MVNEFAEYGKEKSRRIKMLKNKNKDDLQAKKEEIKQEMTRLREEEEAENEQKWLDMLNSGVVKIKHLVGRVNEEELLRAYDNHGNIRLMAKGYGPVAILTLVNSLSSIDERNRIAAAKIISDLALPTKEEELKIVSPLDLTKIEREIIDVSPSKRNSEASDTSNIPTSS